MKLKNKFLIILILFASLFIFSGSKSFAGFDYDTCVLDVDFGEYGSYHMDYSNYFGSLDLSDYNYFVLFSNDSRYLSLYLYKGSLKLVLNGTRIDLYPDGVVDFYNTDDWLSKGSNGSWSRGAHTYYHKSISNIMYGPSNVSYGSYSLVDANNSNTLTFENLDFHFPVVATVGLLPVEILTPTLVIQSIQEAIKVILPIALTLLGAILVALVILPKILKKTTGG